ncbi:MAG: hypothetical protein UY72_C0060G0002 [Candidatus Uhrbacteria bacterium GW2011_GWD2_52_7]|uniref:Uncharacterized protein n=1 Tax=Candidatus Uhrbacteria bacterium GW2011_GWD2_52_7 TaxID=1618989 RepID=A0A0G1XC12_9BACT|nr:MAG: hypothetical protein UY72_C0060G0002 [Candidatus Uhrbacteria bacterium GW2011_GWD2_52_7]
MGEKFVDPSRLKMKGLDTLPPTTTEGRLRIKGLSPEIPEGFKELSIGDRLIQRDSRDVFVVHSIEPRKKDAEMQVQLVREDGRATVTLSLEDLSEKLSTIGSPWHKE